MALGSRIIAWIGLLILSFVAPPTSAQTAPTTNPAETAGVAVYVGDELLRDYNPASSLVVKQTPIDKPKFPVIDIHCHWSLKQSPEALLKAMDRLGIEKAVNLSGGFGDEAFELLKTFHGASPERLYILVNLDFSQIDAPDWSATQVKFLEDARAQGAAGLKLFKNFGLTTKDQHGRVVPVDDARLDPIWQACGRLKMPVLIHSADPTAFFKPVDRNNERWMQLKRHPSWSFYGPEFPTYDEVLEQHNRMIARHPDTVFISAHLANTGENLPRLSKMLDDLPNLYVDISGRVPELGRQPYSARKFLIDYQDRVMFGTDRYPGRPDQPREKLYYRFLETDDEYFNYYDHPFPTEGEWKIYGVFLPDDALRKIYADNARRALEGLPPIKRTDSPTSP